MPAALIALYFVSLSAQTPTSTAAPASVEGALPFSDAQLDYLENLREELRQEARESVSTAAPSSTSSGNNRILEIQADAYIKWLYRNNSSQGCLSYGNPHPLGDNYSGDNGACPELGLTLTARPSPRLEGGFRIQSRYGMDFTDWFENGDLKPRPDGSAQSLGNNHSAPLQLRGIYIRVNQPLPYIDWFLAGTSDLSYFDPWTVGKIRYISRFNGKGLFLKLSPGIDILLARVGLSKLYGTANYNGIEEPLLSNPFWTRDAVYALQLATPKSMFRGVELTLNTAVSLDEEADIRDPDAPGSTNTVDERDLVTAADSRFIGVNSALNANVTRFDWMRARGVLAFSHNRPDPSYVTNLSRGGLGFTNVVFDEVADLAGVLTMEFPDVLSEGVTLTAEYFNIGANFNAIAGARREADVLVTDGFMDGGQLPTLNLENELIDFNDVFYETVIGWHGATLLLAREGDRFDASGEATVVGYNTNAQDRDMDVYPGFGGFAGFTETDLYTYANTNDRGRDLRTVYQRNQDRRSAIFVLKGAYKPNWWRAAKIGLKLKYIYDRDGRDRDTEADDYRGHIFRSKFSIAGQILDELGAEVGVAFDYWVEDGRSGTYAGGLPNFLDYRTKKYRPYLQFSYSIGALSARYHFEAVRRLVDTSDPSQDFESGLVLRSIGSISAQF